MKRESENPDNNVNRVPPLKLLCALRYQKTNNFREDQIANLPLPPELKLLMSSCPSYQYFHAAVKEIDKLREDIRASDTTIFEYTEADFLTLARRVRPAARFLVVVFLGLSCRYSEKLSPVLGHPVVLVPLLCWIAFFKDILPHEYPLMIALTLLCHKYHLDFLALRSGSERRYQAPIEEIKTLLRQGIAKFDGDKTRLQFLTFQLNRSQGHRDMLSTLVELSDSLKGTLQTICPANADNNSIVAQNVSEGDLIESAFEKN